MRNDLSLKFGYCRDLSILMQTISQLAIIISIQSNLKAWVAEIGDRDGKLADPKGPIASDFRRTRSRSRLFAVRENCHKCWKVFLPFCFLRCYTRDTNTNLDLPGG